MQIYCYTGEGRKWLTRKLIIKNLKSNQTKFYFLLFLSRRAFSFAIGIPANVLMLLLLRHTSTWAVSCPESRHSRSQSSVTLMPTSVTLEMIYKLSEATPGKAVTSQPGDNREATRYIMATILVRQTLLPGPAATYYTSPAPHSSRLC